MRFGYGDAARRSRRKYARPMMEPQDRLSGKWPGDQGVREGGLTASVRAQHWITCPV